MQVPLAKLRKGAMVNLGSKNDVTQRKEKEREKEREGKRELQLPKESSRMLNIVVCCLWLH